MPELLTPSFLLLLLLSTLPPSLSSDSGAATAFVYAGCSQPKYTAGSPYQYNLNALIASLANSAGFSLYANFTSFLASPSSPVYGLYQCRGDLTASDCESCVRSSINQLSALCSSASGAAIQLRGCFLRYGNDSFLGQPDTTVLYKKCGGGGVVTNDLMGMRDSVFTGLVGGAGPFRVSRAGYLDGTAQCIGDLTAKECTDCVTEAVATLRAGCDREVSGEAYLGKCYAVVSSNGVSSKSDRVNEAGKTVAVMFGLMAGVILIVIFLSFIRRKSGGKF